MIVFRKTICLSITSLLGVSYYRDTEGWGVSYFIFYYLKNLFIIQFNIYCIKHVTVTVRRTYDFLWFT